MSKTNFELISKKQNEIVSSVLSRNDLVLFEKAYFKSQAIVDLRSLLTNEVMAPIMALQGTRLGFKTDRDLTKDGSKGTGYSVEVVRDCVIEAVFNGLEVTGNEFNIIGGNFYPTKEGCKKMLDNIPDLKYRTYPEISKMSGDKTSAEVSVLITWNIKGKENKETVKFPLKMNAYTSVDALIGKATRKARAWLLTELSGREIVDGEVEDIPFVQHFEEKTVPDDLEKIQEKAKKTEDNGKQSEVLI